MQLALCVTKATKKNQSVFSMPFLRILEKDLQMHIIGAKKVVHHHARCWWCFIKLSSTQNCKKNLQFYVSQRQLGIQFREMSRFSIFFRENVEEFVCVPIGFSACTVEFYEHDGFVDKIAWEGLAHHGRVYDWCFVRSLSSSSATAAA